jgi:hypothetical protein
MTKLLNFLADVKTAFGANAWVCILKASYNHLIIKSSKRDNCVSNKPIMLNTILLSVIMSSVVTQTEQ